MEVAKTLSFENSMESKTIVSASEQESHRNIGNNSELLLNAVIVLCSLVAKQVNFFIFS